MIHHYAGASEPAPRRAVQIRLTINRAAALAECDAQHHIEPMRSLAIPIGLVILLAISSPVWVGALVGAGLAYSLRPHNFVDWVGELRTEPEDPLTYGYRGNPLIALGLSFESVSLAVENGEAEAWLVQPDEPRDRWAIYVHGIRGSREEGYRTLGPLLGSGIPVLLVSYRNDPTAPPAASYSFGLTEWRDLEAAVLWARDNGARDIVLVADSMGGAIAGQFLLRSPAAGLVGALWLDSPALDLEQVVTAHLEQSFVPLAPLVARVAICTASQLMPVDLREAVTIDVVRDFAGPLLLVHGELDRTVTISISDQLVASRTGPTSYLRTNADHLLSYRVDPERYSAAVYHFLESLP